MSNLHVLPTDWVLNKIGPTCNSAVLGCTKSIILIFSFFIFHTSFLASIVETFVAIFVSVFSLIIFLCSFFFVNNYFLICYIMKIVYLYLVVVG